MNNRLEKVASVARFITQSFFAEAFAQVNPRQRSTVEKKAPSKEVNEVMAEMVHHHFEIAKAMVTEQVGDCFVEFRLYENHITRVLKKPMVGAGFERIRLADYTPAMAQEAKCSFTLAKVIALTRMELGASGKVEPVEVRPPVPPVPEKKPMPTPAPKPESTSVPAVAQAKDDECLTTGPVRVSQGRVVFAGISTVSPKGRSPYKTFSVTVQTAQGEVTYSGVDLEKKFQTGQFGINDEIVLTKKATEFKTESNGKLKIHTKNIFVVEVLKKASRA